MVIETILFAAIVFRLSEFEISTMTVSLGMHTQGNSNDLKNDAQQTRRITRVVYHKDFNTKTAVSIASLFFACFIH
jgi:hypothetical protein